MNNLYIYTESKEAKSWERRATSPLITEEAYLINKYLVTDDRFNKDCAIVEAGCGAGRILFNLEQLGFSNLKGFDYSESLLQTALQLKEAKSSVIEITQANATNLQAIYPDHSFDVLIYLQQILSFIPIEQVPGALKECHRIAKPGALVFFSFLNFDGRLYNIPLALSVNFFRLLRREPRAKQKLPWLKLGNKINWELFKKDQAVTYWFTLPELTIMLNNNGFEILESTNSKQVRAKRFSPKGMLYLVCKT